MSGARHPADITLLMMRLATGADVLAAEQLLPRLGSVDWARVVAVASAHLVLPALHVSLARLRDLGGTSVMASVPADALAYLALMHRANADRNRMLRRALLRYGRALNDAGIVPVALKGAASLLDEAAPAAWRFLSDLDLLVSQRQAGQAHDIALRLGYVPSGSDYLVSRDAHYPALVSACDRYAIELHTRVFAEPIMPLLGADIERTAEEMVIDGVRLRRPQLSCRLAHVVAHAQLHHRHWMARRVLLRNLLDLSMLCREAAPAQPWPPALPLFREGEERRSALAMIALWRASMGERADGVFLFKQDRTWAASVLRRLRMPRTLRTGLIVAGLGAAEIRRAIVCPGVLLRSFNVLTDFGQISRRLGKLARRTRQANWA